MTLDRLGSRLRARLDEDQTAAQQLRDSERRYCDAKWSSRTATTSSTIGQLAASITHQVDGAGKSLVLPSENEGLIWAQAVRGFASMVQRNGFAMVALKEVMNCSILARRSLLVAKLT